MTQPAGHALFDRWTGRHASALQAALRMSQDEMAARLGVAKRTIASWHERPSVVIRPELQRALDTAYEQAPEATKIRFARQLSASESADIEAAGNAVPLAVAIAVVVTDTHVLIVCRRETDPSGITWQFPAGIVKPGASASTVAVRETLAETGIHCAIRAALGSRVHPLTGVKCERTEVANGVQRESAASCCALASSTRCASTSLQSCSALAPACSTTTATSACNRPASPRAARRPTFATGC